MKRYTVRCVHFNHYKVKKYFKLFADLKNKTIKKIQALIDLYFVMIKVLFYSLPGYVTYSDFSMIHEHLK